MGDSTARTAVSASCVETMMERERQIRRLEQELASRLHGVDKCTCMRILAGLMIRVEAMPDDISPEVRASAPDEPHGELGPTKRIASALRLAPSKELTAVQIVAELDRLYPGVKHDYVQQVLSRSAKRGGPFDRVRKDASTGMWLYYLRSAPPDGADLR